MLKSKTVVLKLNSSPKHNSNNKREQQEESNPLPKKETVTIEDLFFVIRELMKHSKVCKHCMNLLENYVKEVAKK